MMITSDFLKKKNDAPVYNNNNDNGSRIQSQFFFRVNKWLLSFTELSVQLQCNNNVFILSMSQLQVTWTTESQITACRCTYFTNDMSPSPPPLYLWKSSLSIIISPTDSLLACRNLSIQCFRRGSDGWRPVFLRALRTRGTNTYQSHESTERLTLQ